LSQHKPILDRLQFRRWPEPDRQPAAALLEASPEAQTAHVDAFALDAALRSQEVQLDPAVLTRMRSAVNLQIARRSLSDAVIGFEPGY
jgi:hypothetical protein